MAKDTTKRGTTHSVVKALGIYKQARADLLGGVNTLQAQLKEADRNELVDLLGSIRMLQKRANQLEGIYKEALKARLKSTDSEISTPNYKAVISEKQRTTFDSKKVMAEMAEEFGDDVEGYNAWLVNHQNTTEYTEISVKALKDEEEEDE